MLALGQEFFSNNSLFVSTNAIDCPSYKHRLLQSVHLCIFLIFTCSPFFWRRKWQPTPVFLPRESCEQRRLVSCCLQGHIKSDKTEATQHVCMHWRRKWQTTPVFSPGESQAWRSLVGCSLWGHTESDTTEATQQQ